MLLFYNFKKVSIFWTYFISNSPQCKTSRKFCQRVPGSIGGANGEGIERNADGWTKIEMQTLTFATLQTL